MRPQFDRKMKATELARLAPRLASPVQLGPGTGDPFEKVKGPITDLGEQLESEGQADGRGEEPAAGLRPCSLRRRQLTIHEAS